VDDKLSPAGASCISGLPPGCCGSFHESFHSASVADESEALVLGEVLDVERGKWQIRATQQAVIQSR
jgi:hypothetical protein